MFVGKYGSWSAPQSWKHFKRHVNKWVDHDRPWRIEEIQENQEILTAQSAHFILFTSHFMSSLLHLSLSGSTAATLSYPTQKGLRAKRRVHPNSKTPTNPNGKYFYTMRVTCQWLSRCSCAFHETLIFFQGFLDLAHLSSLDMKDSMGNGEKSSCDLVTVLSSSRKNTQITHFSSKQLHRSPSKKLSDQTIAF